MNPHYEHIQDVVTEYTHTWIERMGLGHWEIKTIFVDSQLIDEPIGDDYLITASTESRWNYLQAKIKWYLPSAVRHDDETLEKTVVHELCHVALSPEQSFIDLKLSTIQADLNGEDFATVAVMAYERLELSTEQMTKCLWRAWS